MSISAASSPFGFGVVPFSFTGTASPVLLLQNNNPSNQNRSSRRSIVAHHSVGFSFSSATTTVRCSASAFSDMDGISGSSLFPLNRCKTLHLVRHAQGIHNVEGDKDFKAYLSPELFDAHLTPLGWNQVDNLRKHVIACGLSKKIELVITSPLLRTMQTAVGVFGGYGLMNGVDAPLLMVENAGCSGRSAISSSNCPPFIAVESCRERLLCQLRASFYGVG